MAACHVGLPVQTVSLLDRLAALVPPMQALAPALDAAAEFPSADIAALATIGLPAAPLPCDDGGLGWGTEPAAADAIREALRLLGRGNLAVGRLFEAHVNAVRLLARCGAAAAIADAARAGQLGALWVTDPPGGGLRLEGGRLYGAKQFCSGAGHAAWAVVTATDAAGVRLALVRMDGTVSVTPLAGGLAGMRAATTGAVRFAGTPADSFGAPGDYLREPDFSTGAWRTCAVTLGGLEALVAATIAQLRTRGRAADPHQQARIGQALIAEETARLWVHEAARRGEAADADPAGAVAYVNLARLAVEQATLQAIQLAQRALGVAAFLRPDPVERLCRDLGVYLRQPAPDAALTEAAAHFSPP
jgi:alkylation response protein AidB-like acyl-CoA dehydrogenase